MHEDLTCIVKHSNHWICEVTICYTHGKVEYRLDKSNIIHVAIGKVSFGGEKLAENFNVLMNAIIKAKPSAAKGQYLRSISVTSTMGPGVKINPARVSE